MQPCSTLLTPFSGYMQINPPSHYCKSHSSVHQQAGISQFSSPIIIQKPSEPYLKHSTSHFKHTKSYLKHILSCLPYSKHISREMAYISTAPLATASLNTRCINRSSFRTSILEVTSFIPLSKSAVFNRSRISLNRRYNTKDE